jgi:hypothetical protein
MLTPEATEVPIPLTGEVRPKSARPRKKARGPHWMTLVGRDRPESYERESKMRPYLPICGEKGGRAVHLGNVGLELFTCDCGKLVYERWAKFATTRYIGVEQS